MEISEDKLIDLEMTKEIHRDDVAMFIDQNDSLKGLVSDLKEYFKLDDDYYEERAIYAEIVKKSMEDSE